MQPMTVKVGFRIGDRAQWSESFSAAQPVLAVPGWGTVDIPMAGAALASQRGHEPPFSAKAKRPWHHRRLLRHYLLMWGMCC